MANGASRQAGTQAYQSNTNTRPNRFPCSSATMRKIIASLLIALPSHPSSALPTPRRIPDILKAVQLQKRQQQNFPELRLAAGGGGEGEREELSAYADVDELYVEQRLDHFSDEEDEDGTFATFRQRIFYTSRYVGSTGDDNDKEGDDQDAAADDDDAPALAFLCVGGEGPSLDASVLVNSEHCTGDMIGLAERLHEERGADVHLFAIEHRFYGESFPSQEENIGRKVVGRLRGGEADGSTDREGEEDQKRSFEVDLSFLSSRQAVRDIVAFVNSPEALSKSPSGKKMKWIAFGGSYPGMLSAWSHLLHPADIHAAVSSSAPVQARLDFVGYNDAVGRDLGNAEVGGSEDCERIFREGHAQVVAALEEGGDATEKTASEEDGEEEDGVERVANMFNVCGGAKALRVGRNQEAFVGDGLISVGAQSNDPSCEGRLCNIQKICEAITNEQSSNTGITSMEVLANIKKMNESWCDNVEWQALIDYLRAPTKENANYRSWEYQTCTEFGFYQTCNEDSDCPYGKGYHDVSQDLEICKEVFGIDPEDVRTNIKSTLMYYGGWDLVPNTGEENVGPGGGTAVAVERALEESGQKRILFVNGSVDPWTGLAVTETRSNVDHPSITVEGSSHHFWTHEIKDSDGDKIQDARQSIYVTVEGWLGLEPIVVETE